MNNKQQIAFISVDNTRTFEDKNLDELYVNQWEEAAIATKTVVKLCRKAWLITVNVLEEHPVWHISFASSFANKNPRELLTYEEVANWTDIENELAPEAMFTVAELQEYMKKVWAQMLWPDHGVVNTEWTELQEPLEENDFDIKVVKWDKAFKDAYSGFDDTNLDDILQENNIKEIVLGWVATDYCVGDTALDAVAKGYKVTIVEEAVRWVTPETTAAKIKELKEKWVKFVTLEKIASRLNKI